MRLSGKPIEAFAVLAGQDSYLAGIAKRIVENTTMADELREIGANWWQSGNWVSEVTADPITAAI